MYCVWVRVCKRWGRKRKRKRKIRIYRFSGKIMNKIMLKNKQVLGFKKKYTSTNFKIRTYDPGSSKGRL